MAGSNACGSRGPPRWRSPASGASRRWRPRDDAPGRTPRTDGRRIRIVQDGTPHARRRPGRPGEGNMFDGLTVAMVTPFRGGALDLDATARLTEFMLEGGVEVLVVSGSTGEAATCTVEERRRLWAFVKER